MCWLFCWGSHIPYRQWLYRQSDTLYRLCQRILCLPSQGVTVFVVRVCTHVIQNMSGTLGATSGADGGPASPVKLKSITKAYEVKHAETGTVFSRSSVLSSAIDPPGRHSVVDAELDLNAFAAGRVTERPDPSKYLTKHSGVGGNATTVMRVTAVRHGCYGFVCAASFL
jgi:hypothetical protein